MDIKDVIIEKCEAVEPVMEEYASIDDDKMREMVLHPIRAGGKRIRPCLTLLACEAVGGDTRSALPAAASVELLHTFTLVHDDIMDHDLQRRGKPTVHSIWGESIGILVGDTLYSSAFKAILDLRNKGVDDATVIEAFEALIEANEELQLGQMMDILFEKQQTVSEEEYLTMIRKKTGALIEAAVKIGCIVGGGDYDQLNAFKTYGSNCGLAFQVKDDVLDLIADKKDFGKPVGSDIRAGKKTLMIVHALEHASEEEKKIILSILGDENASDDKIKTMIDCLNRTGSIEYAQNMVFDLIEEAKSALDILEDTNARENLKDIADYLVDRKK